MDRSLASWYYPNSPKNGKPVFNPCHDWLHGGSEQEKEPLRIWFYSQ
ncbi:transcriptional regulator [Escherichia coli]|nr:transcriptional regulator [Escherichia coli]EKM9312831.1 transcriptional regulator [Escherichia coli]KLH95202.1 transcriptional regulator [Escherichia coli]KNF25693.1 transcriptional regulator [Escherichia coli]KNF38830.1 transcriptional regulator [Escherichia coli]